MLLVLLPLLPLPLISGWLMLLLLLAVLVLEL
jgi:hypothetical protein